MVLISIWQREHVENRQWGKKSVKNLILNPILMLKIHSSSLICWICHGASVEGSWTDWRRWAEFSMELADWKAEAAAMKLAVGSSGEGVDGNWWWIWRFWGWTGGNGVVKMEEGEAEMEWFWKSIQIKWMEIEMNEFGELMEGHHNIVCCCLGF